MTLKTIIYALRQNLALDARVRLQSAHAYELLAAAYGFDSYAALRKGRVFIETAVAPVLHADHIRRRSGTLGLDPIVVVPAIEAALGAAMIVPVPIAELDEALDGVGPDGVSPLLFEELQAAAGNGDCDAHGLLARLYEDDDNEEEGSAYWYAQRLGGKVLTGVEAEWADVYASQLDYAAKRAFHVREAARLGAHWALLELGADDPHRWLTLKAERGDVDAMRELIEEYDCNHPQRCWTWIYLARELGVDLLTDRYVGVHEDGTNYDEDRGGPIYAVGNHAVQVAPLEANLDRLARQAAQTLLAALPEDDDWTTDFSEED